MTACYIPPRRTCAPVVRDQQLNTDAAVAEWLRRGASNLVTQVRFLSAARCTASGCPFRPGEEVEHLGLHLCRRHTPSGCNPIWPRSSAAKSARLSSGRPPVRVRSRSHREFGSRDSLHPPSRTCFVTCGTGRPKRPHSLVAKAADAAVSNTAALTGVWVRIPPGLRT